MPDPASTPVPPRKPPQSDPGTPLSADDRLLLMLAGLIAARMVSEFDDREFQGMRSPRFEAAMHRSLTVARSLLDRHRKWLASAAAQ